MVSLWWLGSRLVAGRGEEHTKPTALCQSRSDPAGDAGWHAVPLRADGVAGKLVRSGCGFDGLEDVDGWGGL